MRNTILIALFGLASVAFAQEDRAAKTLAVWDTNGDGALTPDEFPDKATFKKADRDSDGKVTRDEIAIFLGLEKPPAPFTPEKKGTPEQKGGVGQD